MKKNFFYFFISLFVCSIVFVSCIIDSFKTVLVKNCTKDTILIVSSEYASHTVIDSACWFLRNPWSDEKQTQIVNDSIIIRAANMIVPDSIGEFTERLSLFGNIWPDNESRYFFIIKLKTAFNHTWSEICTNRELYDTLIVTNEMLKHRNTIEYVHTEAIMDHLGTLK